MSIAVVLIVHILGCCIGWWLDDIYFFIKAKYDNRGENK